MMSALILPTDADLKIDPLKAICIDVTGNLRSPLFVSGLLCVSSNRARRSLHPIRLEAAAMASWTIAPVYHSACNGSGACPLLGKMGSRGRGYDLTVLVDRLRAGPLVSPRKSVEASVRSR